MKKFFEKHDLVKIAFGMILLSLILTWIIPQGYFNGAELVTEEISRMGIFDFVTYGLLGMYYFTVLVTFIFVLGAFYQFLSKLGAYQKLTDKIASKVKGKEVLFSLIISFVFAGLASIINEYIVLVAFMPFIITILSKLKMDKMSGFTTTFGAMLVGMIGSTISTKVVGMNVQYLGLQFTDNLLEKIIIFAVAFILYSIFNIIHIKKNLKDNQEKKTIIGFFATLIDIGLLVLLLKLNKIAFYVLAGVTVVGIIAFIVYALKAKKTKKATKAKKEDKEEKESIDMFAATVKDSDKSNTIPLIIVGIIAILVTILAYIPWTNVFGVDWFTKAHEYVTTKIELFGHPIFSYILGNVTEFGSWDIFGVQTVMLVSLLVLQICYKQSIDSVIESFKEGFKKVSKLVVLLLMAYVILEIAVMYPVLPTIIGKFIGKTFNVFKVSLAGILTSLFTSEYQYTINLVYTYMTSSFSSNLNVIALIFQSIYGLVSLVTPASAMLLVGLSYLEIPYKEWFKYIWKFIVAMLIVIIAIAFIIA